MLLWAAFAEESDSFKASFKIAFKRWLPWLGLFIAVLVWRQFFFQYQNTNYDFLLMDNLKADFLGTLGMLIALIFKDIWTITFAAWGDAFTLPDPTVFGRSTMTLYAGVVLAVLGGLVVFLLRQRADENMSHQKTDVGRGTPSCSAL